MSKAKIKILLVEDDLSMGVLMVDFLTLEGVDVVLQRDGNAGWKAFQTIPFDFCILDVMLPGLDGFSLAEKIRGLHPAIPIIFVTARTMKADKIKGFQLGVDDYITKPFDEEELSCRIRAIMGRVQRMADETPALVQTELLSIGSYVFDFANQLLTIENEARRLTQKESEVLRFLCLSKNSIVKRDDLLMAVWGNNNYFNGRSLDVFITKLRKYLQSDPLVTIENIPKVGFVLNG